MTWVYCEPKSRMRILEWAEAAAVFTGLWMLRVRFGRLDVRIIGTIDRAESSMPGDTALELFARLVHHRFFQRIGTTGRHDRACDAKGGGEGFQALRIMGLTEHCKKYERRSANDACFLPSDFDIRPSMDAFTFELRPLIDFP